MAFDIDQIQSEISLQRDLADQDAYTDGYTDARLLQSPQSNRLAYMDGYRAAKTEMQRQYCSCCTSDLAILDSEYYEF